MIRTHHRLKGGAAQLGVSRAELLGPFGVRPAEDHQDDEDQEREPAVDHERETST
ncbi:hypothetical protein [Streptomyces sp. NPDC045470]|uniref:hypothetical protein n=1 Tax=Streptomyces sp. NPDC045470 TaxID=3155469 RepID=UPI0033C4DF91